MTPTTHISLNTNRALINRALCIVHRLTVHQLSDITVHQLSEIIVPLWLRMLNFIGGGYFFAAV